MTRAWKLSVDRWLQDNGYDRSWLAKEIGVSPSTIKRMLEEQTSSEHVQAVCDKTGLRLPMLEVENDWERAVLEDVRQLDPEDLELVLAYIRRLRRDG